MVKLMDDRKITLEAKQMAETNIFNEFREHLANGDELSDLEVALEVVRHELCFLNGARCMDGENKSGTWQNDFDKVIDLIDAALKELPPSGN